MPVKKYRSVEDMPDARWYEPGDPKLHDAAREEWARRNFEAYRARVRREP